MGQAKGMVGGLVDGLGKLGLAGMGIGAITGAVESVVGSLGDLIGKAEGVGDAAARVGLVWGAEMQGVIADNATVANSLGLTKTAYLDQVGALGQLATSLGVGGDAAADMAMGITELAPKLAAYAGVEGQVSSDALEKALLGKTKGLAALGIAITDADKAQAALALGIGGEPSKWNEAQIAQVNYQAILAKTGAAQAAWADNQGDVEVSMQRVSAAIDDAKVALGEKLLPVIAPLAEQFASVLPGAIDATMSVIGPLFDRLGSIDLSGVMGSISSLADALSAIGSGDSSEALDFLANAFNELTGIDVSSWVGPIQSAFADLQAKAQAVLDVISPWVAKFDEVIGISDTVGAIIGVALVAAFGALAIAAGSAAISVITSLAPILIPIAAIGLAVAVLKVAWENDWGGIQGKVAEVIGWIQANVVPTIQSAFGAVQAILANLVTWWQQNGEQVIAVVSGIVTFVVEQFQFLFNIVSGVVKAGIALITGDWSGLGAAVGSILGSIIGMWVHMIQGLITAVVAVFRGLWPAVKSAVSGGVAGIISWLKGEGDKMGSMTLQGLVDGIKSGAGRVYTALKDLASGMVKGFMDSLVMHSPSELFKALGEFITIGLAMGIQKADQKAVEALANVVSKITSVATGLADFGKRLADMVSPTDSQIASAKEKYIRMTLVLTDFIKSISYLGSLLPVSSIGQAGPGQIKAINAGLVQLSQGFPAIKELQGMTADKLLTGGEASWASMLADTVGKIAGVWGGLADNMTKIAAAKFPSEGQLQTLKEATIRIALWAADSLRNPTMPSVGASEFAASMKSVTDALSTVAGLNLSKVTAIAENELRIAGANIEMAGQWAYSMIAGPDGWLAKAGDSETRAAWIAALKDFQDTVSAATSILRAGDVGDLSKVMAVTEGQLRVLGANIAMAGQWVYSMIAGPDGWLAKAGDEATRDAWIASVRSFGATVAAVVDILKATAIGEVDAVLTVNIDAVRSVLVSIRDDLAPAISSIADEWARVNIEGEKATARMALFGGWIKASLDIAKASVVGELEANILVNKDIMLRILVWLRDDFAPAIQGISDAWVMADKQAAEATAKMKSFSGWLGAAVDIAKASVVGELHANVLINGETMKAILVWLRDDFVPAIQEIADGWSMSEKAGGEAAARMKAFADWVRAATDIAKSTVVGELHANILVNTEVMKSILTWLRDTFVPAIQEIADGWGETAKSAAPIVEKMNAFASVIKAATDIAKASSVGDLAGATSTSDLAGKLKVVKANVLAVYGILGEIAQDITAEEAEYRARIASALGGIGKSFGDFGGGVSGIMELVESRLFGGADPTRGDLGHTQRTKGTRANFNASVLTDTIKRVVGAINDAMKDMALPDADDPKIKAITALGDAFGKLGDGVDKLAKAKLPDAKRMRELAAVVAASMGGGQGGLGLAGAGGPGTGGAAGGGPMTLNLTSPVLNFPPITASVQVTTTPTIVIGHATIETLATIIEQKIADKFIIGAGGGSPITGTP